MAHSCLAWLNEAGILFATIGGVLIFIWGPPQPSFQRGVGLILENLTPVGDGKTAGDVAIEAAQKEAVHKAMSRVGLSIILVGFFCQLIASFPPFASLTSLPANIDHQTEIIGADQFDLSRPTGRA
jgi:hypothetical protein